MNFLENNTVLPPLCQHQQNYLCVSDGYEGEQPDTYSCCCNTNFGSLPPVVDGQKLYDPVRGLYCDNKTKVCVGKVHARGSESISAPENFTAFCKKYCNATAVSIVNTPALCDFPGNRPGNSAS